MPDVPIIEQVKAVGREVGLRRNVYPQKVARMSMDQATADREIAAMEAAYRTLQWVLRHRDRLLELAPELREGAPS